MKRFALSIAVSALASSAYAGGEKSTILHCGCSELEEGIPVVMEYKEISVSSKNKGHQRHVVDSESTCVIGYLEDETPIVQVFARTGDDCGELGNLSACSGQIAGDVCGTPVEEEPVL